MEGQVNGHDHTQAAPQQQKGPLSREQLAEQAKIICDGVFGQASKMAPGARMNWSEWQAFRIAFEQGVRLCNSERGVRLGLLGVLARPRLFGGGVALLRLEGRGCWVGAGREEVKPAFSSVAADLVINLPLELVELSHCVVATGNLLVLAREQWLQQA